jgi:hypothetical protein
MPDPTEMEELLRRMLHPEDLGWAVSMEVRSLVYEVLNKKETKSE